MRIPQPAHLPRSASQLNTGTFSTALMPRPQPGQAERGTTRLYGAASGECWPKTPGVFTEALRASSEGVNQALII